jgi:hypothetical protein
LGVCYHCSTKAIGLDIPRNILERAVRFVE